MSNTTTLSGNLTTKVVSKYESGNLSIQDIDRLTSPSKDVPDIVSDWRVRNRDNFERGFEMIRKATRDRIPHFYGRLWISHYPFGEKPVEYGLASLRVVTDDGVGYIVDAFQGVGGVSLPNMKYHGIGTDNTAEDATDSDLVSELTTEYIVNSTRATGNLTEGATANIFKTEGTNTVDASASIVEHGIFDEAAVGSGVLLDRSVFASISLANGDSLQTTYELTFTSGS